MLKIVWLKMYEPVSPAPVRAVIVLLSPTFSETFSQCVLMLQSLSIPCITCQVPVSWQGHYVRDSSLEVGVTMAMTAM